MDKIQLGQSTVHCLLSASIVTVINIAFQMKVIGLYGKFLENYV